MTQFIQHLRRDFVNAPIAAWLWSILFVLVLSAVGPNMKDHSAERAQYDTLEAAERFSNAARRECGENAAWVDLGGSVVQCYDHRGNKTRRAKLS